MYYFQNRLSKRKWLFLASLYLLLGYQCLSFDSVEALDQRSNCRVISQKILEFRYMEGIADPRKRGSTYGKQPRSEFQGVTKRFPSTDKPSWHFKLWRQTSYLQCLGILDWHNKSGFFSIYLIYLNSVIDKHQYIDDILIIPKKCHPLIMFILRRKALLQCLHCTAFKWYELTLLLPLIL